MIPLSQPTKIVESKENRGVFVVEGLYPGYGITIGNSLRRVLLSSLEGAAVTQVNIKGADHEFSTIPGVYEDVIAILLNLKQMRFRLYGEEPQKATLKVRGEREVRAADFKLPASLELVNGDLILAHLTEKSAELEMEIQVERGIGYVPSEEREKEKQEIGSIALDAIFTPIRRVSSRVENMRVGDRTDFNRLTLEIETDGTLTPEEAFYQAVDVLLKQFELVKGGVKEAVEARLEEVKKAAEKSAQKSAETEKKKKKAAAGKTKKETAKKKSVAKK
ncbi:MAG: DNA-directed RNA polymerase subunit alpha [Candidatus Wildermuthbacteria bacterium RIFCSPLOWO2_02_FULL_47_9c]|uniref:DNA-directed RNA polymerase subunit alpha n=2 Tax=Parcubacteria group TaxID=1794811 RepID=A0A837ILM8_9BACT|nr:MAG: DNA-directed RNA polymerase subunit alpha, DNA-directed RNA polymerase subunit alpha [Candidatus Yanofskybacteria bacterium GW2011_GWC1_48_11]KKW04596.1 MAG: DNA-directed RNA polymerase subunit alpha [Parcubacteria group bacterium GW2011_GWB1_49_12]KKW09146.1 MAG: DNA-directed RNA polymerase subunit alpha [Parcubacteria group bacterium GW2011_GWA1_49_26]KKW13518.1 MAG: DNA-directed RNA polymerase subunit alpha [Parcubacteria group bacterium GW2011_GWA2_50_10]OHA61403.1 MAG: DNA-directed